MFFEGLSVGRTTNPDGRMVSVFPVNVLVPFSGTTMCSSKRSTDSSTSTQRSYPRVPCVSSKGVRQGKWKHQICSVYGSVNTITS